MVKQTVMTSVYGVTRRGARDQVQRRIAEKIEDGKMLALVEPSLGESREQNNLQFKAAAYVANLALDSIGTVFREAQSIMDWLAEMAAKIAEQQEPVQWMTPIGFPVIQPYRRNNTKHVKTCMQGVIMANNAATLPGRQKASEDSVSSQFCPFTRCHTYADDCQDL